MNRDDALALDAADGLASCRARFELPDGLIYLDGNSLGPTPRATAGSVADVVRQAWGKGLVRSWNSADWMQLPRLCGDAIGRLIGAGPGQVVAADSTSVNLFKVLSAAIDASAGGFEIVSERDNFPTDLYIAPGLCAQLGGSHRVVLLDTVDLDTVRAALTPETAVLLLTHVNYRTGVQLDMKRLTDLAHEAGVLVVWDLAHSAGAVPLSVDACGVDFAVGCGYKYLNGGPGAPGFLYVAERHQATFRQPLTGWMGHAAPFAFETEYRPAPDLGRALSGTPSVLALTALQSGLETFDGVDLDALRKKSTDLTSLFIARAIELCAGHGVELVTPMAAPARGSQVCLRHYEAYAVMQALIARDVIGDFRLPDIMRFGFAPLYVRYVDAYDAATILLEVLERREWDRPEYRRRSAVT